MASDLKLDLIMTASQRGPNVQLMGNPAVVHHLSSCMRGIRSVMPSIYYPTEKLSHIDITFDLTALIVEKS